MSDERFDVIIVGGGVAGSAAAYVLAKAGMEVLVVERGSTCGAKNMTGGRLYGHSLEKLIPGFADEAPVERRIAKERLSFATAQGAVTLEFGSEKLEDPAYASYTVLRNKFDPWLAEKAETEGAMYVCGIRVDDLIVRDGKVCGVVAAGEEMESDVVILADGVNSLLAQKLGMKKELDPSEVAVGVKEVIKLDEQTISDRFGVEPGEGVAWMIDGHVTGGNIGGGCIYTDKEHVSIGIVTTVGDIGYSDVSVPEMVDRLKEHPLISPLIEGGKMAEYSAHLVTEGGYHMIPELYRDGVLVVGDAAAFVINMLYTVRGMDFAIESGRLAAETIIKAKEAGDFSKAALSAYKTAVDNSFIMRDLEQYKKVPAFMERHRLFTEMPAFLEEVMEGLYLVDGNPPKKLTKKIMGAVKQYGMKNLAGDAIKALGAL